MQRQAGWCLGRRTNHLRDLPCARHAAQDDAAARHVVALLQVPGARRPFRRLDSWAPVGPHGGWVRCANPCEVGWVRGRGRLAAADRWLAAIATTFGVRAVAGGHGGAGACRAGEGGGTTRGLVTG